ncbi:unnamed protein product [Mytilus coruscus]|uniref:Uncharacterized protein n=1 Tax=Mytilus coruscus TaxID=42192 RepID=A0A6J8DIF4_MYTCO|nr:unnamed protein product [Mytilus coruscus]
MLLNKTGKERAYEVIDVFRHLESSIQTLKGEREFLKRQLKRLETQTYSSFSSKDRRVIFYEVDTQTETDGEVNLSILNETLRSRNEELEEENIKLNEKIKEEGTHSGKILSSLACQVVLPRTTGDKYDPTGTGEQNIQDIQSECEKIRIDNDILNQEIRKLGIQINQERKDHEETKIKIKELDSRCRILQEQLEKSGTDINKMRQENEDLKKKSKKDQETISMFKNDMREKINKIHEQENRAQELNRQVEQNRRLINDKTIEASSRHQKTEESNLLISQLEAKLDFTEKQLQEMKRVNTKLDDCNNELRNNNSSAEQTIFDLQKRMTERDAAVKDLEKKLSQLDEQYNMRGQTIEEKKVHLEELKKQIQNKESELTLNKQQMDKEFKQLKNELSLEAVNFRNEKIKTKDLENQVSQFEEQISDLNLTNNKLETDLEIKETTATQEKVKLQETVTELSKNYGSLLEKYEVLKKEKEKLTLKTKMKKQLSFHSVLKQPQSDQAVGGIMSLLQAEFHDADLDIIQESKRSKNVPLLVVLYNLSRLTDDANGALNGVEAASDVALVVLHSKEIKKPSEKILTEPDFKKLGIIVDISFLSAKGIISNDTTDNAIKQLSAFINKFTSD